MGTEKDAEFDEFVLARAGHLRRVAFLVIHDWQLAEDVVQDALVKVYLAWPRIRPASLEAYVRRAVINTAISATRKARREVPSGHVPDTAVDDDLALDAGVCRVLSVLPPRQRAVVALRFLDDLAVAEVAEILGISEGSVKSQTSRGLSVLRRALSGSPEVGRQTT